MTNFIYFISRLVFQTVGRLSTGIQIAYIYGFTSGKMLEYVYNNKPSGITFFGKIIDHYYLSHKGWESIRQRMSNLVEVICDTVGKLNRQYVKITDIAGGTGLYLFKVIEKTSEFKLNIVVRDIDDRWIDEGNRKADVLGLSQVIKFKRGDAFSKNDLTADIQDADIVIASGFYDWFENSRQIQKSLRLIFQCMPRGGHFIFTIQTKHFNVKFTNAMFLDFHKRKLTMTTTSHQEVLKMIELTGFQLIDYKTDEWGYYTVYRTRK